MATTRDARRAAAGRGLRRAAGLLAVVAALCLAAAGPARADSPLFNRVKALYTGQPIDTIVSNCTACHSGGAGVRRTSGNSNLFSAYANAIIDQLEANVGGYVSAPSGRLYTLSAAQMDAAIRAVEPTFSARLTTVQALNQFGTVIGSTNTPSGTLNVPAETEILRFLVDAGPQAFLGTPQSATGFTLTREGAAASVGGSGGTYTHTLPDRFTRRDDRAGGGAQPYTFASAAQNSLGISGRNSSVNAAAFEVQTANFLPVATGYTYIVTDTDIAAGSVALPLSGIDPDDSNAVLTFTPTTPVLSQPYGSLTASGATATYTIPAPRQPTQQTVTFQYSAVDEEGGTSAPVTVSIVVPPAAPPPAFVANDDAFTIAEDSTLSGADVKADNGSGADDLAGVAPASVTFQNTTPAGTLNFNQATGVFDYTPPQDFTGTVTFTYLLTDGNGTDQATVTITVTPVNDPPVVAPIVLTDSLETDGAFTASLLQGLSDPDGNQLTVSNVSLAVVAPPARTIVASDYASVTGSTLTIDPSAITRLDNNEVADLTVTYQVSDGIAPPVTNTLTHRVVGLDNGLGRLAGAYADSISVRYNGHFDGQATGNGACHTCHIPGQVLVDVDEVTDCQQNPPVFNQYGLELCLDRARFPNAEPLSNLGPRMDAAEPNYVPRLSAAPSGLRVGETAAAGAAIGAPLSVQTPGRTVDGQAAQIVAFLIEDAATVGTTDETGEITVDDTGQLRVAGPLTPGFKTFVVLPVNDAGQRDNNGTLIAGKRSFFPTVANLQTVVTVEVFAELPVAVADSANTAGGTAVTLDVTANDTGGVPTGVAVGSAPANGTATVSGLTVVYTPDPGFAGTDSFTYTASNSAGTSNAATVTVTVVSPGGLVALADTVATAIDTAITIDVLANDTGAGAGTVVTLASAPGSGTATVSGQSIVFTPAASFTGTVQFAYDAANPGSGGAVTGSRATVTVNVVALGGGVIANAVTDPVLRQVAGAFDAACSAAGGGSDPGFLSACANLTAAAGSGADLTRAMQALQNEEHIAGVAAGMTAVRSLGQTVFDRLDRIRAGGARGFDLGGLALSVSSKSVPGEALNALAGGLMGVTPEEMAAADWGLFVAGSVTVGSRDATGSAPARDVTSADVLVGADVILDDGRRIGAALGFTTPRTEFSGGGSIEARGLQATVYGGQDGFLGTRLNLDGFAALGRMEFESNRRILFTANGATVDTAATAAFDATYVNLGTRLSFSNHLGRYGDPLGAPLTGVRLTWSGGLDYLAMDVGGYTEAGGGGLALATQGETYQSLLLTLDLEASRPVYLVPDLASEVYGGLTIGGELLDGARSVTASFVAGGAGAPSFTVTQPGDSGLDVALRVGTMLSFGIGTLDIDYTRTLGRDDTDTHRAGVTWTRRYRNGGALTMGMAGSMGGAEGAEPEVAASAGYRVQW